MPGAVPASALLSLRPLRAGARLPAMTEALRTWVWRHARARPSLTGIAALLATGVEGEVMLPAHVGSRAHAVPRGTRGPVARAVLVVMVRPAPLFIPRRWITTRVSGAGPLGHATAVALAPLGA